MFRKNIYQSQINGEIKIVEITKRKIMDLPLLNRENQVNVIYVQSSLHKLNAQLVYNLIKCTFFENPHNRLKNKNSLKNIANIVNGQFVRLPFQFMHM